MLRRFVLIFSPESAPAETRQKPCLKTNEQSRTGALLRRKVRADTGTSVLLYHCCAIPAQPEGFRAGGLGNGCHGLSGMEWSLPVFEDPAHGQAALSPCHPFCFIDQGLSRPPGQGEPRASFLSVPFLWTHKERGQKHNRSNEAAEFRRNALTDTCVSMYQYRLITVARRQKRPISGDFGRFEMRLLKSLGFSPASWGAGPISYRLSGFAVIRHTG